MKLKQRANGYYYIYFDRLTKKSLKTKDKTEAARLFNMEKELIRQGKVIELDKIKYIKLCELKVEYLATRDLNVTPETKDNDELAFRKFIEISGDMSARKVDRSVVDNFKANLLNLGHSRAYINILLRSLRAAFYWAKDKEYISDNPFGKKRGQPPVLFRLDDEIPRFFFEDEIEALDDGIKDPVFHLAFEIYLYHGLRRAELVRLMLQDVDFTNDVIYVRKTKGKKDRVVPIHPDVRNRIEGYVRSLKSDIGPLFPKWRNPDTYSRLFKKYARLAGLREGVKLKGTRHSCGTYGLRNGVDIKIMKELLGHQDIKTTEIYAKVNVTSIRTAMNKLQFAVKKKSNGS
jgi:integrase